MPSIFFLFLKSPLLLIHSSNKHSLNVCHMADITEALEDCVRPHLCPSGAEISGRDRLINRPRNAIHNCSPLLISHTSHTKSPLESKELKPVSLKGNRPEYSLEGLMLKLSLRYLGHLMQTAGSLEKPLMLAKIEGRRRRGQ